MHPLRVFFAIAQRTRTQQYSFLKSITLELMVTKIVSKDSSSREKDVVQIFRECLTKIQNVREMERRKEPLKISFPYAVDSNGHFRRPLIVEDPVQGGK